MSRRIVITEGEHGKAVMPYSEVCMHLRVAGLAMHFIFLGPNRGVQLVDDNDRSFSFPITPGEAGLFRTNDGRWTYEVAPCNEGQAKCWCNYTADHQKRTIVEVLACST